MMKKWFKSRGIRPLGLVRHEALEAFTTRILVDFEITKSLDYRIKKVQALVKAYACCVYASERSLGLILMDLIDAYKGMTLEEYEWCKVENLMEI